MAYYEDFDDLTPWNERQEDITSELIRHRLQLTERNHFQIQSNTTMLGCLRSKKRTPLRLQQKPSPRPNIPLKSQKIQEKQNLVRLLPHRLKSQSEQLQNIQLKSSQRVHPIHLLSEAWTTRSKIIGSKKRVKEYEEKLKEQKAISQINPQSQQKLLIKRIIPLLRNHTTQQSLLHINLKSKNIKNQSTQVFSYDKNRKPLTQIIGQIQPISCDFTSPKATYYTRNQKLAISAQNYTKYGDYSLILKKNHGGDTQSTFIKKQSSPQHPIDRLYQKWNGY